MKEKEGKIRFINCPNCESRVAAEVLGSSSHWDDDISIGVKVYLLSCPVCKLPICAVSEEEPDLVDSEWQLVEGPLERVWPYPKKSFFDVPTSVKQSLEEAEKCFSANANLACTVMCRRTLEAVCVELGLTNKSLVDNLQELRVKGIIDGRLFDWSQTLRQMGNIGAHANKGHISKQDARDTLDFTMAICEYVYELSNKYEKFKARQQKQPLQVKSNIDLKNVASTEEKDKIVKDLPF